MKILTKFLAGALSALVLVAGNVHAEAISSDSVMQTQSAQYNKQQLLAMKSQNLIKSLIKRQRVALWVRCLPF